MFILTIINNGTNKSPQPNVLCLYGLFFFKLAENYSAVILKHFLPQYGYFSLSFPFAYLISYHSPFIFTDVKTGKRNAFQLFRFVRNSATTRGTDGKHPMQYIWSEWLFMECVSCLELSFFFINIQLHTIFSGDKHTCTDTFFLGSRLTKMQLKRHLWPIKPLYVVHKLLLSFCPPSTE